MPITIEPRPDYAGPLVRVPLKRPGTYILMTEEEARKRGYLPPVEEKKQPAGSNKKRVPAANKGR